MDHQIENKRLRVHIAPHGGALTSVFDKENNHEWLYQKEDDSWQGQDIAIFPFIARLKNKKYTHHGQEYSLLNHGLCRYHDFVLEEQGEDYVELLFASDEETLKQFPFSFRFHARYELQDNALTITYRIENAGEETMPFGLGAHPAFGLCASVHDGVLDTSDNEVRLDQPTALTRIVFDEKGEFVRGEEDYGVRESLPTDKATFQAYQTLCVQGKGIDHVQLVRGDGKRLDFTFDKINYLVLWSFLETGRFVAVEPWMSLPDFEDAPLEIMEKKTLLHLEPKQTYTFSYTLRV